MAQVLEGSKCDVSFVPFVAFFGKLLALSLSVESSYRFAPPAQPGVCIARSSQRFQFASQTSSVFTPRVARIATFFDRSSNGLLEFPGEMRKVFFGKCRMCNGE